jgi:hypothetical protein
MNVLPDVAFHASNSTSTSCPVPVLANTDDMVVETNDHAPPVEGSERESVEADPPTGVTRTRSVALTVFLYRTRTVTRYAVAVPAWACARKRKRGPPSVPNGNAAPALVEVTLHA